MEELYRACRRLKIGKNELQKGKSPLDQILDWGPEHWLRPRLTFFLVFLASLMPAAKTSSLTDALDRAMRSDDVFGSLYGLACRLAGFISGADRWVRDLAQQWLNIHLGKGVRRAKWERVSHIEHGRWLIRHPKAADVIKDALGNLQDLGDETQRVEAAKATVLVGLCAPQEMQEFLVSLLNDGGSAASQAALAMGEIGDIAAAEPLCQFLGSRRNDDELRATCAQALQMLNPSELGSDRSDLREKIFGLLESLVTNDSEPMAVRSWCAWSLARWSIADRAQKVLAELLGNAKDDLRKHVAEAAGRIDHQTLGEELRTSLEHVAQEASDVGLAAQRSLIILGFRKEPPSHTPVADVSAETPEIRVAYWRRWIDYLNRSSEQPTDSVFAAFYLGRLAAEARSHSNDSPLRVVAIEARNAMLQCLKDRIAKQQSATDDDLPEFARWLREFCRAHGSRVTSIGEV